MWNMGMTLKEMNQSEGQRRGKFTELFAKSVITTHECTINLSFGGISVGHWPVAVSRGGKGSKSLKMPNYSTSNPRSMAPRDRADFCSKFGKPKRP